MIGRDINFRISDMNSVFKYPYPTKYLKRAFSSLEHASITELIENEKPILQNTLSNAICNFTLFHKAFGNRLKFIYVLRNPINVINNNCNKGYGSRIGSDPTDIEFCFEHNSESIPVYALRWESNYKNATPLERMIYNAYALQKKDFDVYRKLSAKQKKQVLIIDFDKFVVDPYPYCKVIGRFIKRSALSCITDILKQENCPRKQETSGKEIAYSSEYLLILKNLLKEYRDFIEEFTR